MKKAETDHDISNVEAWAVIIEDMLGLMPDDCRLQVLQLALQTEEASMKEREQRGGAPRAFYLDDAWRKAMDQTPGMRHWNAVMRLKSLVIQVFARNIRNNHSANDAAKILFATHPHGCGSGALGDYIDDLPRTGNVRGAPTADHYRRNKYG